ncbi:ParA family protein [Clostridium sporogenes]|uniref:ParA family protein n=1 Tax=Clostridium sporogenes TaxID=1509 RepID=UPI00313DBC26
MKIITFSTLKGGVGKSSCLFNLSGILAQDNKKVLAIDIDPQGNTTNNFGIDRTAPSFKSFKDIMEDNLSLNEVIIKAPIDKLPSLDIIPSSIFLTGTEMRLVSFAGREYIFKNYIEENIDIFSYYDYILIDTNPSMSIINQNAFVAADNIILVSDISMNSLEGSELFIALWNDISKRLRLENKISGFLINMFDRRINLSSQFFDFCKSHQDIGKLLFNTVIPNNVKIKESELEAKPISVYDTSSSGYKAYIDLYNEMKERGIF